MLEARLILPILADVKLCSSATVDVSMWFGRKNIHPSFVLELQLSSSTLEFLVVVKLCTSHNLAALMEGAENGERHEEENELQ
jgi:hypothetical protein